MDVSPLSPARQCARSYSFGMRASFVQGHAARHQGTIDQRGYDADLLGDRFARATATRWTVCVERFDLIADDCGLLVRCRPGGHAQAHLVRMRATVEGATVQGCAADEVKSQRGEPAM